MRNVNSSRRSRRYYLNDKSLKRKETAFRTWKAGKKWMVASTTLLTLTPGMINNVNVQTATAVSTPISAASSTSSFSAVASTTSNTASSAVSVVPTSVYTTSAFQGAMNTFNSFNSAVNAMGVYNTAVFTSLASTFPSDVTSSTASSDLQAWQSSWSGALSNYASLVSAAESGYNAYQAALNSYNATPEKPQGNTSFPTTAGVDNLSSTLNSLTAWGSSAVAGFSSAAVVYASALSSASSVNAANAASYVTAMSAYNAIQSSYAVAQASYATAKSAYDAEQSSYAVAQSSYAVAMSNYNANSGSAGSAVGNTGNLVLGKAYSVSNVNGLQGFTSFTWTGGTISPNVNPDGTANATCDVVVNGTTYHTTFAEAFGGASVQFAINSPLANDGLALSDLVVLEEPVAPTPPTLTEPTVPTAPAVNTPTTSPLVTVPPVQFVPTPLSLQTVPIVPIFPQQPVRPVSSSASSTAPNSASPASAVSQSAAKTAALPDTGDKEKAGPMYAGFLLLTAGGFAYYGQRRRRASRTSRNEK